MWWSHYTSASWKVSGSREAMLRLWAWSTALYWRYFFSMPRTVQLLAHCYTARRAGVGGGPFFVESGSAHGRSLPPFSSAWGRQRKSYSLPVSALHLLLTNMESAQVLIFLLLSDCIYQSFYITGESISNKNKELRLQNPLAKRTRYISGTRETIKKQVSL